MKMNWVRICFVGALAGGGVLSQGTVQAALLTNSWTNGGSGKWETSTNWSSGSAPSTAYDTIAITNNGTKTVTIDATTAGISSVMTISNLTLMGNLGFPGSHVDTLHLNNTGVAVLTVKGSFNCEARSALTIDNSELEAGNDELPAPYGTFSDDSIVTLNSGLFVMAANSDGDGTVVIGNLGSGLLTVNGGTLEFNNVDTYLGMNTGTQGMLSQSGGFTEFDEIFVGAGTNSTGTVSLSAGILEFNVIGVGEQLGATSSLWVTGGLLDGSEGGFGDVDVGDAGTGQMTISNGTVMAIDVFLAVGPGSQGTLTLAGGTLELSDALGDESVEGTGTVWMTGGTLITPEIDLSAQEPGVMEMTISNGTLSISTQDDGLLYIQDGTLTVAGGSSTMALLYIYQGTVWVSGGQLNATLFQNPIYVYSGIFIGDAQMIVSNGTTTASSMRVGDEVDSSGTFTVAGGVSSVFSNLTIGFGCGSTGTGTVIITGGSLFVTNAAHNAVLDLENGTLTLSGGTLVADILVKTNPCAFFQQTGGTLVVGGVTNPSSLFSITAISRAGNNMAISWQTPGGVTNIVQATNGGPGGSYNTNFVDLSPQFIIPSGSPITTNYLDVGGATNIPSRYYRVRLVP